MKNTAVTYGAKYSRMQQVKSVEDSLIKFLKNLKSMVCWGKPYHFRYFKGYLPKTLLGPFLNPLPNILVTFRSRQRAFPRSFEVILLVEALYRLPPIWEELYIFIWYLWILGKHSVTVIRIGEIGEILGCMVALFYNPSNARLAICYVAETSSILGQYLCWTETNQLFYKKNQLICS